ncbi:hypothetical protein KJ636_04720 [Patescibacteria group bacterium]|nr:hypothetical protein [Patescibacteria group bacterium]
MDNQIITRTTKDYLVLKIPKKIFREKKQTEEISKRILKFISVLKKTSGILPNLPQGITYTKKIRKEAERKWQKLW